MLLGVKKYSEKLLLPLGKKLKKIPANIITGLGLLTGLLISKNVDDITGNIGPALSLINNPAAQSTFLARNAESFSSASSGGTFSDIAELGKLFLSPIAEIFGANPYTPEGWRSQGEFVKSGRGTDFVRTNQNIGHNARNVVLGQGDLAP